MKKRNLKYPKEVIKNIAQEIDMGMICFLNTDTMEYKSVLGESYEDHWSDDEDELDMDIHDIVDSWENSVRIEQPGSSESFIFMERFIENCIPENDPIKRQLIRALSKPKPFHNFRFIIDDSDYRQSWFDFKQLQLEQYVLDQLL